MVRYSDTHTHTISATVIAGFGYASFRAFEVHSEKLDVPSEFEAMFTVIFVLATGVIWEILEFASGGVASLTSMKAPLVVMGIDDIVSE